MSVVHAHSVILVGVVVVLYALSVVYNHIVLSYTLPTFNMVWGDMLPTLHSLGNGLTPPINLGEGLNTNSSPKTVGEG